MNYQLTIHGNIPPDVEQPRLTWTLPDLLITATLEQDDPAYAVVSVGGYPSGTVTGTTFNLYRERHLIGQTPGAFELVSTLVEPEGSAITFPGVLTLFDFANSSQSIWYVEAVSGETTMKSQLVPLTQLYP